MGSDVGQVDIDNVSVVTGHIGSENLTGTPTEDPTDPAVETDVGDLTLVFEDNFDDIGGQPNQDDWTFDIGYGQGGWGNGEAQYYTSSTDNSHIVDVIAADASELDTDGTADGVNGALKIIANKTGNEITSARSSRTLMISMPMVTTRSARSSPQSREHGQRSGCWVT